MKIGLRSVHRNKVVSNWDSPTLIANRDGVGEGEQLYFTVEEISDSELQAIANRLAPFLPQPAPTPPGPDPEPPPVDPPVDPPPDLPIQKVPAWVYERGQYDLRDKAQCGLFTEEVARQCATPQYDVNWGHIKKELPQNSVQDSRYPQPPDVNSRRHAVDAIMHRASGQVIDIIFHSESTDAAPQWFPQGTTNLGLWYKAL